jgi:hypothetical protein
VNNFFCKIIKKIPCAFAAVCYTFNMNKELEIIELRNRMQNLRDALIEIKAAAWANKGNSKSIPVHVDNKLQEIETKAEKALEENEIWV